MYSFKLEEKADYLENHSKRNNIVLYGVGDKEDESWVKTNITESMWLNRREWPSTIGTLSVSTELVMDNTRDVVYKLALNNKQ